MECFRRFRQRKPLSQDELNRIRRIPIGSRFSPEGFCSNRVSTAKYSIFTFIPILLIEQFSKLSNAFFLFVALLEQVRYASPVGRYNTAFPLLFVITVSAIKEIIEDIKRRKSDIETNNKTTTCYNEQWVEKSWKSLRVGEIVKINSGETFPADIVLLATSENTNICYVQTASLDGETNYKVKQCNEATVYWNSSDRLSSLSGVIECEGPCNQLYSYNATMVIDDMRPLCLNENNLILRGCQLVNTSWIIGVIVYTGVETKIMLNSTSPPIKRTEIDRTTNWLIVFLISIVFLLTVTFASIYDVHLHYWLHKHWYADIPKNMNFTLHYSLITFFILYHNIIPVSLTVTLEFVKVGLSYMISNDKIMNNKAKDKRIIVKTSSIVEELGQVSHIFTDKTGTLTSNVMTLKKFSVGRMVFGEHSSLEVEVCEFFRNNEGNDVKEFLIHILLCNTVIPEANGGPNRFQSSSPDETALVNELYNFGFMFVSRTQNTITLNIEGREVVYDVIHIIEFTSSRKCMSVIVRTPDDRIVLYCKGADIVIFNKTAESEENSASMMQNYLECFAKDGLRTLCIAKRELSKSDLDEWSQLYYNALSSITDREKNVEEVSALIETNLLLLGVTGIEDKLQEGVTQSIATLREAKIKFWMLTGDRPETAINVAYASKLIDSSLDVVFLSFNGIEDCKGRCLQLRNDRGFSSSPRYSDPLRIINSENVGMALVISGESLSYALDPACVDSFIDIALISSCVICCRVSPLQKKQIVCIVKDNLPNVTTLAIGDGANDCSMIQAADVGIGIIGKEGMQAANTADFAISDFSFLCRLLLVHGASSYRRICNCIYFSFYKNLLIDTIPLLYCFFNLFSGQVMFSRVALSLFNLAFTSWPPLCLGIFDRPCSIEAHLKVPYLYESLKTSSHFGFRKFIYWLLNGVCHAVSVFYLCFAILGGGVITSDGNPISMLMLGMIIYTHCLIVITFKAALEIRIWSCISHVLIWGGLFWYVLYLAIFCRKLPLIWPEPELLDVDILLYRSPIFWISFGIPALVILPDFIFYAIRNTWFKPSFIAISDMEQQNSVNWAEPTAITNVHRELNESLERKEKRTRKYFGFAFSIQENASFQEIKRRLTKTSGGHALR